MCSCGYSLVSSTATVSTHISGIDYHVRPPRFVHYVHMRVSSCVWAVLYMYVLYTVCMCMLVYTSIHCIHVLFLSVVAVLVHLCM